jgi:hypothetical protein
MTRRGLVWLDRRALAILDRGFISTAGNELPLFSERRPTEWPDVVILDDLPFRIRSTTTAGGTIVAYRIFGALGVHGAASARCLLPKRSRTGRRRIAVKLAEEARPARPKLRWVQAAAIRKSAKSISSPGLPVVA